MKKSFKLFWTDYNDMCIKPQMTWMKKHWKGYIVFLIASFFCGCAVGYATEYKDEIKDKVKSIFKKDEET